jgi:two-component system phosphate regulon sensor histidine kinase PhoR
MSRKSGTSVSQLALRNAVAVSLSVALVACLLLRFVLDQAWSVTLLSTAFLLMVAFATTYLVILQTTRSRFDTLLRIANNISHKKFEDYDQLATHKHDELDYLIKQAVRSSKTVEREIQRLNRIENYRKEFIGDISHELKTPIFAIQGFLETLLNGALEDENVNRSFLQKAMRNVNRLIYLTKDLMEISKLETGELKSDIQEVQLKAMVQEVVESLQYKANNEQVEIDVHDIPEHLTVSVDRNQIKQVLINLVENAIKYNRPGGRVTIGLKPYPSNSHKVLLFVEDTGIGIDPEHLQRVTERFFRVDKSRSREKGGTGLGLSIVKHIMEAHNEQLFIDSNPPEGSTFSFTLTKAA